MKDSTLPDTALLTAPLSPLTADILERTLAEADTVTRPDGPYLHLLRWLVWLPLLSIREIARIMQRDEQTVWGYASRLREWNLVDRVLFDEPGWPRRHQRYYITDLGLYVLVSRHPQPLSVSKLAASYAIERADLLARLVRPQIHLVLCDLVTRLLCDCPQGYQLTSYQQPWKQLYRWRREKHAFPADAALLLGDPSGAEHAFYVLVDQPERLLSQRQERAHLQNLLALRQATQLRREALPPVLLLSQTTRFPFWAALLEQVALAHSTAPISGAIADYRQLASGLSAPIWLTFHDLLARRTRELPEQKAVSLFSLFGQPASPRVSEFFSQRRSFEHLLAQPDGRSRSRGKQRLARYVGDCLQEEALQLVQCVRENRSQAVTRVRTCLYSVKEDRMHIAALLTLSLSAAQKTMLALLTRHLLLSLSDLMFHLQPDNDDVRFVQHQMTLLCDLQLVRFFYWKKDVPAHVPWRERVRYEMTDTGLRFMAMRHGVAPTHYLQPLSAEGGDSKEARARLDRRAISPLDSTYRWVPRGMLGFAFQLPHTNDLYRGIRHIITAGRRTGHYEILDWMSPRESLRYCYDPLEQEKVFAKPDAELCYRVPSSAAIEHLLIEYDRATTDTREYRRKFLAYDAYQRVSHAPLPRIVMITPNERSSERIHRTFVQTGIKDVHIVLVLEQDVLRHGLLPVLGIPPGRQAGTS